MVKGIHEPLISVSTFYEVQSIINTKRKVLKRTDELKATFLLTGFLTCPLCGRRVCGSFSRGSKNRYPYYHCRGRYRTRISAVLLNYNYERKHQPFILSEKAVELFDRILLHVSKKSWAIILNNIDIQRQFDNGVLVKIFRGYAGLDTADKRHLVKFFSPSVVNFQTGEISLGVADALSKILL